MGVYVHHVPGRLRVRIPAALAAPTDTARLIAVLRALDGVADARVNPRARSLVIEYDPEAVAVENILDRIKEVGAVEIARPPMAASQGHGLARMVGAAAGQAIFGAVLRTGFEKSLAGLVGGAIR